MLCPYCQGPVCEDSPACPRCGLTMEKAGAVFGALPHLVKGVSDSAGVLRGAGRRRIHRDIAAFERRFPQCGFTAAFMALGKDIPGATYTFWVFNRSNLAGELNQGSHNRHILLLVDIMSCGAWITPGYGLEPFIGRKTLDEGLEAAVPHFAAGKWGAGVGALLARVEEVFREVVVAIPRVYGLPQLPGHSREKSGLPATAW